MKGIYEIGLDTNWISLGVSIGTPGAAYTVANKVQLGSHSVKVAESEADNGSIKPSQVGVGRWLRGSCLLVQTIVDFGALDPAQWDELCETLKVTYQMSGGLSGDKSFELDADDRLVSANKKFVMLAKSIKLV